ncbi:FTR1 family iron permease [Bombiscardovia apis]|uniref:FTR1 family iron permease n=1 Tax=Bombiscardovia apis TaxID=2932182 RepID=UPI003CE59EE3
MNWPQGKHGVQTPGKTAGGDVSAQVRRCRLLGRRSCLRLLLTFLLAVIAGLTALTFAASPTPAFAMPSPAPIRTAHYSSWSEVAQAAVRHIEAGQAAYSSGDYAGASSDFGAAYNSVFVADNMARALAEKLSAPERRYAIDRQFQNLQGEAYFSDSGQSVASDAESLKATLTQLGQELDSAAGMPKPEPYAQQIEAQTLAERKRIDAARKNKDSGKGNKTWTQVAHDMTNILDYAYEQAAAGKGRAGADLVNKAYYQYYEKLGFEKTAMNAISGSRVSQVEYQFKQTRMAMSGGKDAKEIKPLVSDLQAMLVTDAKILDGGAASEVNPVTSFLTSAFGQAFVVLLREGLEAILVVAAIIAYLVKAGHKSKIGPIYWGIAAGLAASGVVALLFSLLFNGNGPEQEILEGVVALVAMVMLLYTSNWMLSKASTQSWNEYIKSQTASAISKGSVLSLAALSFLAVFREGAETVMFYQAIFAMAPSGSSQIWAGFGAAAVLLVIIFVLIRFTSVKIPIRPFFAITSALMALMVVIFAGGGVHALIEGDLISASYLPGVPTSDWLGLYPYKQSIGAQILALILVIALFFISWLKSRRPAAPAQTATATAVSNPPSETQNEQRKPL